MKDSAALRKSRSHVAGKKPKKRVIKKRASKVAARSIAPAETVAASTSNVHVPTIEESQALVLENREIGERLARTLLNRWHVRLDPEDITSIVGVALCEAAQRFDKNRGVAFRTFFFYHLRGALIKEISEIVSEKNNIQLVPSADPTETVAIESVQLNHEWPFPLFDNQTPEKILQKREFSRFCWEACTHLDKLEQEIVIRYFIMDQQLTDIAEELGYCRSHVSRVKSKALKLLHKLLDGVHPAVESDSEDKASESADATGDKFKVKAYSGGRGRRKSEEDEHDNAKLLTELFSNVVNS